jgi:hypothetical protein
VLSAVVLLAGCASHAESAREAVLAGDPHYALTQLAEQPGLGDENYAESLEKSLPNHPYELSTTGRVVSCSDALAIGTVTKVEKGIGVVWRDEDDYTVVDFDNLKADTRTALVTMSADHVVGEIDPGPETLTFRVLVPSQADRQRFLEGLAGLRHIAVVLSKDPTPMDSTPWRPIMSDRLIGVIGPDGSLTLPALDTDPPDFEGKLHTAAALLGAARAPVPTELVAIP